MEAEALVRVAENDLSEGASLETAVILSENWVLWREMVERGVIGGLIAALLTMLRECACVGDCGGVGELVLCDDLEVLDLDSASSRPIRANAVNKRHKQGSEYRLPKMECSSSSGHRIKS